MIVKIYKQNTDKQVAEIHIEDVIEDGFTWEEFVEYQSQIRRTCAVVEDNHVSDR